MFTVFANIRIQSQDRLDRLITCLTLLKRVSAEAWVFNIRGELGKQAAQAVQALGLGTLRITHLESEAGWFSDTAQLLKDVHSEFLVLAVEDHFLMCNPVLLENAIEEMHRHQVDQLEYSWFWPGRPTATLIDTPCIEGNYINTFTLDLKSNITRHQNFEKALGYRGSVYCVSLVSVIRTSLLARICDGYKPDRRRFDHRAPFDAERSGCDIDLFPIRTAYPKLELFAALDDDNIVPGSALQHRGMFHHLTSREALKTQESDHTWLYRDLHFQVPSALTQMPDTKLQFRVYKYAPRHQELVENLSAIAGVHIVAMAEALKLDPSIDTLVDYESLSGMVSLLFLKVFGRAWATYKSDDDRQAVRAHENIFSNRVYAGYKLAYLEQGVTAGAPAREDAFLIYADYGVLGPANPPTTGAGNRLGYIDIVGPHSDKLMAELLADLQATNLRVLIAYSEVGDGHDIGTPGTPYHQLVSNGGFTLHSSHDFVLEQAASPTPESATTRRCAIYRR